LWGQASSLPPGSRPALAGLMMLDPNRRIMICSIASTQIQTSGIARRAGQEPGGRLEAWPHKKDKIIRIDSRRHHCYDL
jgi:hypothetical protein